MSNRALAAALTALLATPGLARADAGPTLIATAPSADRMAWSPDHPVSIGTRTGVWESGYLEPGLGGHIRFQPWAVIGIEGYTDNFVGIHGGQMRKDLVNGFNLFFPLTRNRAWTLSPQFGVCDEFQIVSPFGAGQSGPTVTDLLIGAHAGVQAEVRLGGGLALEAAIDGDVYAGHSAGVDRWTASLSDSLAGQFVAETTVGFNYYF